MKVISLCPVWCSDTHISHKYNYSEVFLGKLVKLDAVLSQSLRAYHKILANLAD